MRLKFKKLDWLKEFEELSYCLMNLLFGVLCGLSFLGAMHYFAVVAGHPVITLFMFKIVVWMFMFWALWVVFCGLRKKRDLKNKAVKIPDADLKKGVKK